MPNTATGKSIIQQVPPLLPILQETPSLNPNYPKNLVNRKCGPDFMHKELSEMGQVPQVTLLQVPELGFKAKTTSFDAQTSCTAHPFMCLLPTSPSPNFWVRWEVRERELQGFSYSFYVIFHKLIQWKK